jgi:hypothetical protein
MFEELTHLEQKMNTFVLNVRNLTQYSEPLQSGSNALHVMNGTATVAPHSATAMFVATTTLMMTLIISRL